MLSRCSAVFTLVLHHGDHLDHLDLDGVELTDAAVQALSKCDGITRLHFSFAELLTDTALLYIKVTFLILTPIIEAV